jgi:hypothetical protein
VLSWIGVAMVPPVVALAGIGIWRGLSEHRAGRDPDGLAALLSERNAFRSPNSPLTGHSSLPIISATGGYTTPELAERLARLPESVPEPVEQMESPRGARRWSGVSSGGESVNSSPRQAVVRSGVW